MEEILEIILEEFAELLPETEKAVKREQTLPEAPNMIHVAIGMRRTGKTYFLYQQARQLLEQGVSIEQILYINFEDERLLPMSHKELGKLLDAFYTLYPQNHDRICYFFLDEIQNVDEWALVIRRFHDRKKIKFLLTGSSAKLLSKEISTSLRGRSITTELWAFSFQEYWKAHEIPPPSPPIGKKQQDLFLKHLKDYFITGGFPAVQNLHENERRTVLQTYVDTVVFRDIIERYKITNTTLIKYLIKSLINNVGAPFAINKFYNDIKSQGIRASKDTLYQYLEYIEDAFLLFNVPIYDGSIRKGQNNPKKVYAIDNGLIFANVLSHSPNWGNLFENQLYLDLRRQGKEVYYYKTSQGYEIDFLVKNRDGTMEFFQACWDISNQETLDREERALQQAEKELGIKGQIIHPHNYLKEWIIKR